MILAIIILFIFICLEFIFFYIKILSQDKEIEELYDMYYDIYEIRENKDKKIDKITVLRKVGK